MNGEGKEEREVGRERDFRNGQGPITVIMNTSIHPVCHPDTVKTCLGDVGWLASTGSPCLRPLRQGETVTDAGSCVYMTVLL